MAEPKRLTRTYTYPLRPTTAQAATLTGWLHACCVLYNAALEERRGAWRKCRVSVRRYQQQVSLTQVRAENAEYAAIPAWVLRSALARLDEAFAHFFRRVKAGQRPGYPRFRSQDRYDSFDMGTNPVRLIGRHLILPKLGHVRLHLYRPLPARAVLRRVVIRRAARGWCASLVLDIAAVPAKVPVQSAVGVDVGLASFASLSTGEQLANPRFLRRAEGKLAARNQELARKQKGSAGRAEAKRRLAAVHERIRNQRLDHARKLAKTLVSRFDLIAHEDLRIANLVRGRFAKSISDAAWSTFLHCLACKAEEAGKRVVAVDPRGTSQRCSRCGATVAKPLSERVHRCPCGLKLDRDVNAARNILALGWSAAEAA